MKKKTRRKSESAEQRLQRWLRRHYTPERIGEAEAVPLRRDMITLLEYVDSNTVVGTQSTGNMPLKAIREVTARFVDPPALDYTFRHYTRKMRTEYDVWPLHFLHILADVGGLVQIAPGRKWQLMPDTLKFFEMDPLFQLAFLLYVWWFQINWLVAFPYGGIGEDLPESLEPVTLARLRAIRPRTEVPFVQFADGLVAAAGLTWRAPNRSHAAESLRSAIKRMVLDILEQFGVVNCTYRDNPLFSELKDLVAFEITPLGVALLDSLLIEGG